MAVSTTTNRVSFSGDGSTTSFSYPYALQSGSDLKCKLRNNTTKAETTKTYSTHFTFSGTPVDGVYPNGGTITTLFTPAATEKIVFYVEPPTTQLTDPVDNDSLPAASMEQAWDKLALSIQRLKSRADRSVGLTDGNTDTFDPSLPVDIADGAGKILVINDDGDGFLDMASAPAVDDLSTASTNAAAAAASASAAAASETAAAASETAAAASQTAAAASASAAAASAATAAASGGYNTNSSHGTPQDVAGAGTITFTAGYRRSKIYVQGSGGAQTAANISAGTTDGDELLLVGCSDTNLLTLDTLNRIKTNGTCILGDNQMIKFNWDNGQSLWVEETRSV